MPTKKVPILNDTVAMRRFVFERHQDASGTSGTGIVVEGVEFTDGTVVVRWKSNVASTCVYQNIKAAELIHGHGGMTTVRWIDEP